MLAGKKLSVVATCTTWLAVVKPKADAEIVADPKFTPVTCGVTLGAVLPSRTITVAGDIVTFDVSLLESERKTPPTGAGLARVTGKGADCPNCTDTLPGRMMPLCTVMLAVVSRISGSA